MAVNNNKYQKYLPAVDSILREPSLQPDIDACGREVVADIVRQAIDKTRRELINHPESPVSADPLHEQVMTIINTSLTMHRAPAYKHVINATGIILHTGLGRAVLPAPALEQIQTQLKGYSILQLDPRTGKRSRRDAIIEQLLQKLTGAEGATVVNNNAAATAIVLNTIAKDKEVIVSRGQLVEIGGAFRLPEVMAFSGARLVEVGTTNKTHARDYTHAITENTAAILRVHPSNYKIQGFSSEVPLNELVDIAHTHDLVMIDDVGAGSLIDMTQFGFEPEPTLPESIAIGADIVTSSADKLIGASQGGLILGRRPLIEAIRKNQFARIVRVDKMTLTILEATLKLFLDQTRAQQAVPTLEMIVRSPDDIQAQAQRIKSKLENTPLDATVSILSDYSQTGSGSLPTQNLVTCCVSLQPKTLSAETLAQKLRMSEPPIFTRIRNDQVLLDPRTLRSDDEELLMTALVKLLTPSG